MPTVTLYGSSDDLIELDGDVYEEFNYRDAEGGDLVAFSDGTLLSIKYDSSGTWRITPVVKGTAELAITQAAAGDDDDYTDRATLTGDIRWATHGVAWAKARR